jgi:Pyruvate/2-oxoacid:ferredoxin oxidoreductase gamma subunit
MPKSRNRKIKKKNKVRTYNKVPTELVALTRIKGEITINIIMIAMMAAMVGTVIHMYIQSEKQQDKTSEIKFNITEKQNAKIAKFIDFRKQYIK